MQQLSFPLHDLVIFIKNKFINWHRISLIINGVLVYFDIQLLKSLQIMRRIKKYNDFYGIE